MTIVPAGTREKPTGALAPVCIKTLLKREGTLPVKLHGCVLKTSSYILTANAVAIAVYRGQSEVGEKGCHKLQQD